MTAQHSTHPQKLVDEKVIKEFAFQIFNELKLLQKPIWDEILASYFKVPGTTDYKSWRIARMELESNMLQIYRRSLEALRNRYIDEAEIYLPLLSERRYFHSPILHALDEFMIALQKGLTAGEFCFEDPTLLGGHAGHIYTARTSLPYVPNFRADVRSENEISKIHITGYQTIATPLQTVCEGFRAFLRHIKLILSAPNHQIKNLRIQLLLLIDSLLAQVRSKQQSLNLKMEMTKSLMNLKIPVMAVTQQSTGSKQGSLTPAMSPTGNQRGERENLHLDDLQQHQRTPTESWFLHDSLDAPGTADRSHSVKRRRMGY